MPIQSLDIDNSLFQKLKNNPATNFINAEDLDRQFSFIKTYINSILVTGINALTNGEIAGADDDNPVGKWLFNDEDGLVSWSFINSNLIPDNYLSCSTFEKGPVGSILAANDDGEFNFLTPTVGNNILSVDNFSIKWRELEQTFLDRGFLDNHKLNGDKFIKRTLKPEHLRPGTLSPNIPELIARTSKIIDGAITKPKILPNSLELGNFDVSASFPFQRLYGLLKPPHFKDAAITSKIIRDNAIPIDSFMNYKWPAGNPIAPEYFKLKNYLFPNIIPQSVIDNSSNRFNTIQETTNAYYLFRFSILINDPKYPVSYYWPKREFGSTTRSSSIPNVNNIIGEFQVPNSIPDVATRYKYKYVTMGKLKNIEVAANHFNFGNTDRPVRVAVKIFFYNYATSQDSTPYYAKSINENPANTVIIRGMNDRLNYLNLKILNGFVFYNLIEADFPNVFKNFVLSEGMCMESQDWFGGNLLSNSFKLKNIHIAQGTIGKRHFASSELARMKAAADAKFNG